VKNNEATIFEATIKGVDKSNVKVKKVNKHNFNSFKKSLDKTNTFKVRQPNIKVVAKLLLHN
jgi:hypothetical protein